MCYENRDIEFAKVCRERDELKIENEQLKAICEKQAAMNGKLAVMALESDDLRAEIERLNKENFWLTNGGKNENR